ncbi:MarR family winged helix-turn-helix transcriptional regulator [Silanimonas sp.]|uniref:MarR family winged helix-turn-helix transcriptional regulator n=1 Tax=Silanimonas sp. TaxID=1929290 RepID=UPI001BB95D47|nr:MarR family winged helix-turn-helix transcriptional regulator [Silanimonas sp.]MBS3896014.1 winged helix-turn-helix transcriptional regulator [Silanimonas sp.]MBS3924682.1 winged helix-turn-helix transcriptional regulator [Xanthomonadaceae bacterium]
MLDLERFLPYRLSVLSNRISTDIARLYDKRHGLSIPEWRVIAVLARRPGLSATEVAQRTAMDKVAVSRAVSALLDGGRILRDTDGDDRRRSVLRLSEAGRAIYADVAPRAMAYEQRLLEALQPDERQALDRLLARMEQATGDFEHD